jgi:hypothetical protein
VQPAERVPQPAASPVYVIQCADTLSFPVISTVQPPEAACAWLLDAFASRPQGSGDPVPIPGGHDIRGARVLRLLARDRRTPDIRSVEIFVGNGRSVRVLTDSTAAFHRYDVREWRMGLSTWLFPGLTSVGVAVPVDVNRLLLE